MALDLKGQELKTELAKLGVTEQHYKDWRDVYRAKAATAGAASQRVGGIGAKDIWALQDKYNAIKVNPKSDPTFYAGLPQNVKDALGASEKSDSYKRGMAEVAKIANRKYKEDYQGAKIAAAKSPDTITAEQSIEP